jgi:hypothetical protein
VGPHLRYLASVDDHNLRETNHSAFTRLSTYKSSRKHSYCEASVLLWK